MPKRSRARALQNPDAIPIRARSLTSAEVCEIFHIPRATLHFWVNKELIPQPLYNPESRQLLWTQADIDAIQKFLLRGAK